MSRQAVVHSSQLRYSHLNLELPPCFHRLHEPRSSCIHTIGCPFLPWHCRPHLVGAKYGGYPSCLSRSNPTIMCELMFYESAILIGLFHIPAVATSVFPKPHQPTALQIPQSVTPDLYRTTLLVNKVTTIIRSIRK